MIKRDQMFVNVMVFHPGAKTNWSGCHWHDGKYGIFDGYGYVLHNRCSRKIKGFSKWFLRAMSPIKNRKSKIKN